VNQLLKMQNFSVLISVYSKETAARLSQSLDSIFAQSKIPAEIVLVKDGVLTNKLNSLVDLYCDKYPGVFKIIQLSRNCGLGMALNIGLINCTHEYVARMDSDDICASDRFEKQLHFMIRGGYDLVGCNIEEFNSIPGDLCSIRNVPEFYSDILNFSRFRNPFNHPSVMFRKSKVLSVGNYNSNYLFFEDWHLFVRMLKAGSSVYNIQESLLFFRVGDQMDVIKRRSGFKYVSHEFKFATFLFQISHINFAEYIFYLLVKIPIRVLPSRLIFLIYYKKARIRVGN
jgi:glycosyltransferase involved in cell wall biosynthesis